MSDEVRLDGPDGYWSEAELPSRGQMRSIAIQACKLLDVPAPASRLDATVILARLVAANSAKARGEDIPTPTLP